MLFSADLWPASTLQLCKPERYTLVGRLFSPLWLVSTGHVTSATTLYGRSKLLEKTIATIAAFNTGGNVGQAAMTTPKS